MGELIFNILKQGRLLSYLTLQSFSPDAWNYVNLGLLVEDTF